MGQKKVIVRDLFRTDELILPDCDKDIFKLFEESREIVSKAIIDVKPYAICLMLSGGDDSITALKVALMMGVKIDFVIHGVTGTGLPEVQKYVKSVCDQLGMRLIYADAGTAFEDYVKRKGFFGKGDDAHIFSYHVLKAGPFRKAVSKHIRKGVEGRKILLLNGVRVEESDTRADNYGENPYRWDGNNLWVNIIHWWNKKDCLQLLSVEKFERSPVALALGRSGECNCGTMQNDADRIAASTFNPQWGEWLMNLRREITRKFGWDINQNPNKKILAEMKIEAEKLKGFMPMCVGCKSKNQHKLFLDEQ
jgi:3'-phosphoadenosine 5'-phosphosulfate sulfotransferase (PAPS reductase)/FAD synthetase